MPWPLPASQPGPDPFMWQSLSLLLPEVGAAAPVLLRVPTTVSGDEPTGSLQTPRGSLCLRVGVCFAHGYSHNGGSLGWEDSRGNHVGGLDWPSFGVQLYCPTGAGLLGGWTEQLPSAPVEAGSHTGWGVHAHCMCLGTSVAEPSLAGSFGGSKAYSLVPFGLSSRPGEAGDRAASRSLCRVAPS